MWNLLFQTVQMMALTFAIGFVVAGVIKGIALAADYFEFHREHHDQLVRLKKLSKLRAKEIHRLVTEEDIEGIGLWADSYHGVSKGALKVDLTDDFLHGMSRGGDDYNILNYYYPNANEQDENKQKI